MRKKKKIVIEELPDWFKTILFIGLVFIFFASSIFLFSIILSESFQITLGIFAILFTISAISFSASRNANDPKESDYFYNTGKIFFKYALSTIPILIISYAVKLFYNSSFSPLLSLELVSVRFKNEEYSFFLWIILLVVSVLYCSKLFTNIIIQLYKTHKYLKSVECDHLHNIIRKLLTRRDYYKKYSTEKENESE